MIYTLKIRHCTEYVQKVRDFWVSDHAPAGYGYVYEVSDEHPGTSDRQVSDSLDYCGDMMVATPDNLARKIRAARRREIAWMKKAQIY